MAFSRQMNLALATGGFIGRLPWAPGTFGSLLALPLCFVLAYLPFIVATLFIAVFTVAAIAIAGSAETMLGAKDPGCIVIDEVAGQMVALLGLPFNFPFVLGGFVAFRFFDIVKPFPIRWLEKRLPGGIGIVADDIVAGLMANVVLRIVLVCLS